MKHLKFILVVAALTLTTACSTLESWQANPKVQTAEQIALQVVESSALNAGIAAIDQYTSSGTLDGRAIAAGALNGAAAQLRTIEATPNASSQTAVASAVNAGTGVPQVGQAIAPTVSSAVQTAIQHGAAPDAAVETAAAALDQAAAKGGN